MRASPLNPELPQPSEPLAALFQRVVQLERKLEVQEKRASIVILGTRSDLAAGVGPRAQFGVLSDGTFGAERWTSAGVRQLPTWS